MRLLNARSLLVETFNGAEDSIPPYAILSHTWDDVEVTFDDLCATSTEHLQHLPEFQKVKESCLQAALDGFVYVWIDTCCIDKSSSAELSEAINSMFKWYQQSSICYVYLKDFEMPHGRGLPAQRHAQVTTLVGNKDFCSSRWFDRGWTLQELIAPRRLVFFDRNWVGFGSRDEALFSAICDRTRILPQVFTSRHCMCSSALSAGTMPYFRNGKCKGCNARDNLPDILGSLNAAIIMNWATRRSTTRVEDMSYSLIGLFNINLPLLYGEGNRAFMRLQSAILARNNDHSILLWREKKTQRDGQSFRLPGCLSSSLKGFEVMPPIVAQREYYDFDNEMIPRLAVGLVESMESVELTETLLKLTLWLCPCKVGYPFGDSSDEAPDAKEGWALGILNCHDASDYLARPAILISHMGADLYRRVSHDAIFLVNPRRMHESPAATTLSLYHQKPNIQDPGSNWTLIRQVSGHECVQKRIRLLVRPSGPSLLRSAPRGFDQTTASIDAVCLVINQPLLSNYVLTVNVIGGYPRIYSHDSCPPTVPMLRSFVKYSCKRGFGLMGGVHLFELGMSGLTTRTKIYVIWGLYHDEPRRHGQTQQNTTGRPWCRIFRASDSSKDIDVPIHEAGKDDLQYQKQLRAWLVKRGSGPCWQMPPSQQGFHRQVMPDLSTGNQGEGDRILDLFPNSNVRVGVSARMNTTQGFGVMSNDVEMTFFTPDCRGWRKELFDGSPRDQKSV